MDIEKYNKYYSYLLLLVSAYYFLLLPFNYDAAYKAWDAWAYPYYTNEAYVHLYLTYILNIGSPVLMFLVGILLFKKIPIKWYVLLLFIFFLVLDTFLGKVVLLIGIGLWALGKYYAKNT